MSCSLETRPEPYGTRRRSTADRESRMKSRASRSSCRELPFSENTTTEHTAAAEPRRHCLSRCVQNRDWYPARSCGSRRAPRGGGPTGKCTEAFYGRDRDAPAAPLVESRLPTAIEAVWRPFGAAARPACPRLGVSGWRVRFAVSSGNDPRARDGAARRIPGVHRGVFTAAMRSWHHAEAARGDWAGSAAVR